MMMTAAGDDLGQQILPTLRELLGLAEERAAAYASAAPCPHAVLDNLVDGAALGRVVAEMPALSERGWTTWDTTHEWKHVFDQPEQFGPTARQLYQELNSSEFVQFLERLTGIGGLIPDPHLHAAGYFNVERGGFLNVHLDFTRNPLLDLDRRVNVLVYLNSDWQPEWGGQLELWDSLEHGPATVINPTMGRMVVFSTPGAAHGHPQPVRAPDGRSRLCFSAYYFTSPNAAVARPHHGVVFNDLVGGSRAGRLARRLAPPIVVDGARRAAQVTRQLSVRLRAG